MLFNYPDKYYGNLITSFYFSRPEVPHLTASTPTISMVKVPLHIWFRNNFYNRDERKRGNFGTVF